MRGSPAQNGEVIIMKMVFHGFSIPPQWIEVCWCILLRSFRQVVLQVEDYYASVILMDVTLTRPHRQVKPQVNGVFLMGSTITYNHHNPLTDA